jgi:hypothetical protein
MVIIFKLINYSGMLSFASMVLAIAYVALKPDLQLHKIFGVFAFGFGCAHLALILYKNWKVKLSRKKATQPKEG